MKLLPLIALLVTLTACSAPTPAPTPPPPCDCDQLKADLDAKVADYDHLNAQYVEALDSNLAMQQNLTRLTERLRACEDAKK